MGLNNFSRNNLQSIPVVSWVKYSFWNYLFWNSFFSPLWTFKFVCGAYSKAFPILEERGFSMTNMANLEVTILSVFMADRATYTHMQNTCHGAKWYSAFSQFTSPQVPTFYRLLHPITTDPLQQACLSGAPAHGEHNSLLPSRWCFLKECFLL